MVGLRIADCCFVRLCAVRVEEKRGFCFENSIPYDISTGIDFAEFTPELSFGSNAAVCL